ncbi:MAG: hypothetical protein KKB20_12320 [Proteobacteria bacterium]|nr:hypothetical protein [Pseudomonadota bacterium]
MTEIMDDGHEIESGQPWDVDLFRPEDAPGVCRLFRTVYGANYPISTFIDPERLIEENAARRTISSVARTPKGDIVGHNAIFQSGPYPGIYESGAGVVSRGYRGGHGIFSRMVQHGQDFGARDFGLGGIYGESVCNHVFSQKMTHGLGWESFALEVDLMPGSAYTKEQSATGRVASLFDFMKFRSKPHTVYLPAVYENSLKFMYEALDDPRDARLAEGEPEPGRTTRIQTRVFDFAQVARLAVIETGPDLGQVLDQEEAGLTGQGVLVIQVWLQLAQPRVGWAAERLRERGYFLGGLLPRWFDGDGLLMHKIFVEPNWDGIRTCFDRGRRIVELVHADWERSRQGG